MFSFSGSTVDPNNMMSQIEVLEVDEEEAPLDSTSNSALCDAGLGKMHECCVAQLLQASNSNRPASSNGTKRNLHARGPRQQIPNKACVLGQTY